MESRLRVFLLGLMISVISPGVWAQDKPATEGEKSVQEIIQQEPVIQPEVARREVRQSDINTENFELTGYAGFLSIEDFGTDTVYGLRLDYHITEDFFIQGSVGQSEAGTTSFERLGGGITLLTDDQRDYTFYTVAIGYNLLPGEAFVGRNTAFNTSLYIIAGAGNTTFAGDDRFTVVWGGGYSITATDWLAAHIDFRDHMFDIDVTGEDKTSHNFEVSLGLSFFF